MSSLSSHVLNTVTGKPARGMKITLEVEDGNGWKTLHAGETNSDGRVTGAEFPKLEPKVYRMSFDTKAYFDSEGVKEYFYPVARIEFIVAPNAGHYHVPLLVSPFSYSTYRGS